MEKVCVGVIVGAHGVRGLLKVKSFTVNPGSLLSYGPLTNEDATQTFSLKIITVREDQMTVSCEGINNRTQAEALKGVKVFADRKSLPALKEEEFYYVDLMGLEVWDEEGALVGEVIRVSNYGAGDFLEVDTSKGLVTIPFSKEAVPVVNLKAKKIIAEKAFILEGEKQREKDQ